MDPQKIARINELYRRAKAEGLTDAEKKEQKLLRLLAQYRVCKLACGCAALGHKILGVAERVLNIEQFLRAHGYRSSLFFILSNFSTLLLSAPGKNIAAANAALEI